MSLPDPVQLAIPGFVILVLLEIAAARFLHKGHYEVRDTAASLLMGFGSNLVGLLSAGAVFAAMLWVYRFRVFHIGYVWWAFVLLFFAEDLKDIGTFNPLKVAMHEWVQMARDVWRAKGLNARLGYLLGPPGWSHDGSRKTSSMVREAWLQRTHPETPR